MCTVGLTRANNRKALLGFSFAKPLNVAHQGERVCAPVSKLFWCDGVCDPLQVVSGFLHCSPHIFHAIVGVQAGMVEERLLRNSIDQCTESPAIPPVISEVLDVVLWDLVVYLV